MSLGDTASPSTVLDSSPTEANATDASLGEESANVQDDDNVADQTNGKDNEVCKILSYVFYL